jgi:hypothetical protein
MTKYEKIKTAIEKFNEIRIPEAKAELIEFKEKNFLIKFSGHMCFTCGTYDYFEDLIYELKGLGINAKIKNYQRQKEDYYLVDYQIKIHNLKNQRNLRKQHD